MRKLIFLIDDDHDFRESIAEFLMEEDFFVNEAVDGRDALDQLEDEDFQPDLIMVDIAMPNMHGLEFVERIRKVRPSVPVVICSSKSGLQHDLTVKSSPQVKGFFVKPVDIDDLLDGLHKVLVEVYGEDDTDAEFEPAEQGSDEE